MVLLQCKFVAITMHGLANVYGKVNKYSFEVVWQWTKIAAPNTSFFEKLMDICFIIDSYLSLKCLIMTNSTESTSPVCPLEGRKYDIKRLIYSNLSVLYIYRWPQSRFCGSFYLFSPQQQKYTVWISSFQKYDLKYFALMLQNMLKCM